MNQKFKIQRRSGKHLILAFNGATMEVRGGAYDDGAEVFMSYPDNIQN